MINLKKMWKDTEDSYAGKVGYFFLSPPRRGVHFVKRQNGRKAFFSQTKLADYIITD